MNRTCITARVGSVLIAALGAFGVSAAQAQTYPSKPIEVVAHTSAGSGTDIFARAVSDVMAREKMFPQPITVSNRTGAAGVVAFNYMKSKKSDPHVVLTIGTGSFLTAASRPELGLGLESFTPIAFFAQDPQAVAVRAESKFKTFKELVEAGKREPNSMVAAVTSAGGTGRYALYRSRRDGRPVQFVTFKGGSEAIPAVLGGHVDGDDGKHERDAAADRIREDARARRDGRAALQKAPNIPTLKELGYNIVVADRRGVSRCLAASRGKRRGDEAAMKRVTTTPLTEFAERNMFEDKGMGSAECRQYLAKQQVELQDS